jgi:hypothetical protein
MTLFTRTLLITLFILSPLFTWGQKLEWSVQPKHNFSGFSKVLGENSDGVFVLHHKNNSLYKEFFVEKFNHSLSKSSSVKINIPKSTLQKITILDGSIDFISSTGKRVSGKKSFFIHSINTATMKVSKAPLLESNQFDFGDSKVAFSFTNDRNNMAMVHCEIASGNKSRFVFTLLDSNRYVSKSRFYKTGYKPNNVEVLQIKTDNDGNIYMLAKIKVKSRHPYKHVLVIYNSRTDEFSEVAINNNKTYLSEAKLHHDREHKSVQVIGLYGNSSENQNIGYFKILFSLETNELASTIFTPFNDEFIKDIIGVSNLNAGVHLSSFRIKTIQSRSDGGVIVLAERYFLSEQSETIYINGLPQTSHRNVYNYEEILILSINKDGSIDWNKFINKQQSTMYDGGFYSSFITLWGENNFYIIFNDKMSSSGNTLMYTIDMDGEINQSIILKSTEYNQSIIPIQGRQTGYNRLVVPSNRDKSIKLLKLTISE